MCCGAGRAALRGEISAAGTQTSHRRAAAPGGPGAAAVRYVGGRAVRVRGTATGTVYDFRGGRQTTVAAADVAALVRSGYFVRG
jgi:hypothetical protein